MRVSVMISTYNQPAWLEKVIWGYENQTHQDFEIVIADDGSGDETKDIIGQAQERGKLTIKHCWHEDQGYQRQKILNVAIMACETDYLVCTDGDCIPRQDFVQVHAEQAKPGYFISGGYCKLPMDLSKAISEEDIQQGRCFEPQWLKQGGLTERSALRKLKVGPFAAKLWNTCTPAGATWNNCNSSGWIPDLKTINGFDERMQYGGADRELGERLMRNGIKPIQLRYSAICVHLDHARGYAKPDLIAKNRAIRDDNAKRNVKRTPFGIEPETNIAGCGEDPS